MMMEWHLEEARLQHLELVVSAACKGLTPDGRFLLDPSPRDLQQTDPTSWCDGAADWPSL